MEHPWELVHQQCTEHSGDDLEELQSPGAQGFCVLLRHPSGLGHPTQPTYFSKNRKNKQGDVSLPFFLSLSHFFFPLQVMLVFHPELKCRKKLNIFWFVFWFQLGLGFWGLFSLFYFTLFF